MLYCIHIKSEQKEERKSINCTEILKKILVCSEEIIAE